MTFRITDITRCSGQGHWHCTVLVNGTATRTITIEQAELALDTSDLETLFLGRVRSAVKEAGASTFQQARTALLNKDFQL